MKKLFILPIIICSAVNAKDITTIDGRVFRDAKIIKRDAIGVTISHAGGTSLIPLRNLPDDFRKKSTHDTMQGEAQLDIYGRTIQNQRESQVAKTNPAQSRADIEFASANEAWEKIMRSCEGETLHKALQVSKSAADLFADDTQIRDISFGLQRIEKAITAIEQAKQAERATEPEIQRLLRNADVSDKPNSLVPSDKSGEKRAATYRNKAKDIQQRAENAIEQAEKGLLAAIEHTSDVSEAFSRAGILDGALALSALLKRVSVEYGVQAHMPLAFESLKSKVIEAKSALDKAKRHLSDREFQPANQALKQSLDQFPGYRPAIELKVEVDKAGQQFTEAYKNAEALKLEKRYEESQSVLSALLEKVVDFQDANTLSVEINKIISNKEASIRLANNQEQSGNLEEAYAIFDQYNSKADIMRVAYKLAAKKEADGDFLGATTMYIKAERGDRAASLKEKLNHQLQEYERAKMLLAENNLDEALAIYAAYNDDKSASEALIKAGKLAESNGQFDLAIELYRKSASASDLERAQNAYRLQNELIAQGKVKEEAGDYESAVQIFENAGAMPELQGAALKYAKMLESRADYETAAQNYELAGQLAEAKRIRETFAAQIATGSRTTKKLSAEEVFKKNIDAVVTIIIRGPMSSGHGSGFFVKKGGWVITNNHVIEGNPPSIKVRLNDRSEYPARVAFASKNPDFAILKVDIPTRHRVVQLGSSESVNQGQTVFAIGTPVELELQGTITQGIVSNKEIKFRGNPVIAISAAINHGNSGGPLFTEDGKVVGINTFGLGTAAVLKSGQSIGSDIQNMNFAITIDDVKSLIEEHARE